MMRVSFNLLLAGMCLAGVHGRAWAQAAGDRPDVAPAAGEIVVTATGLHPDGSTPESGGTYVRTPSFGPFGDAEDRDIPFSTLSIPQVILQDQQVHSAAQALRNDPSVIAFDQDGRAQQFQVRGFNVGPQTGVYRDGLDLLESANPAIEDTERVDVLRGAASVLYGFATPGGLVQYQSKLPLDTALTQLEVGYISGASGDGRLDVSRRFGPGGAFGLRANIYEQDGDLDLPHTREHRDVEALAGDWRVAEGIRLWTNLEHDRETLHGGNSSLFVADAATGFPDAPPPDRLYGQRFLDETIDTRLGEIGLDAERGGWRLHAVIGAARTTTDLLSTFNGNLSVDQTGTFDVVPTNGFFPIWSKAYRATLSKTIVTGAVTQTITLAATGSSHIFHLGQNTYGSVALGTSSLADPVQFARPALLPDPYTYRETFYLSSQIVTDKIDIGPHVTLIGGGVRSTIDNQFKELDNGALFIDVHQDKVTPLAALLVHASDKLTVYGSFIQALQPGDQAPGTAVNAYQSLPPYVGDQYEVGVKAEPLPGLELKAALFRVYEVSGILRADNVFAAQGRQRNQGVEFTATGKLLPSLTVFGGVTALTAGIHQEGGGYLRAIDVPHLRANLYAELALPGLPGLALLGGAFYTSRVPVVRNPADLVAAGYPELASIGRALTADAGLRYAWRAGTVPLSLRAYVSNIGNAGYFINSGSTITVGAPRSVRLTLGASL